MNAENTKLIQTFLNRQTEFGEWVWRERNLKTYSQTDFARMLNISRQHLINIEKGHARITPERAIIIAEALDLPADEVLIRAGYNICAHVLPPELKRYERLSDDYRKSIIKLIEVFYTQYRKAS